MIIKSLFEVVSKDIPETHEESAMTYVLARVKCKGESEIAG